MKTLTKPLVVVALAVALFGAIPSVAGAATDPSGAWSEPLGGPAIVDGTDEQAEQGFSDLLAPPVGTFSAQSTGDVVTISGAGNGHGIGMSQWGSQGRALAGQTYTEILGSYYQGTTLAQDTVDAPLWVNLETELVKVYLKVEENVTGGAPVVVTRDDTGAYGGIFEEATLSPGDTLVVEYVDRGGPIVAPISNPRRCTFSAFTAGDDAATATPSFASAEGSCVIDLEWDGWNGDPTTRIVIDKRWQHDTPATTGLDCVHKVGIELDCAYARGTMHIRPDDYNESEPYDTGFHVVQELSLDDYARGIGEMPYSWDRDALKVQAVAGRTFARYLQQVYRADPIDRQWSWSSLYDKGPDQTYLGWGFDEVSEFGTYAANWVAAVDETAGELLTNGGNYMSANYSASNGGASENNEDIWGGTALSYLRSTSDPLDLIDANWANSWTRSVPLDYFAAKVGLDTLTSAQIVSTYVSGSPSDIEIKGTLSGVAKTRNYTATEFMTLFSGTAYRLYAPRILSVNLPDVAPPPPPPPPAFELERLWGSDRYATAVAVSKDSYPQGSDKVYIATGQNFPD
ncbi:MAG: cell wall-binding repeat-containing protein, partial [Actinomycetota bacterium]|nr:cell wall-binding repeat-containing protein [Actinomycetota bacterium]